MRFTRLFQLATLLGALVAAGAAETPTTSYPGMREYTQQLTLRYADPAGAEQAALKPLPLPNWYQLAFSARWDDSSPNHLKTHAAMAEAGLKGTFYLNQGGDAEYCRKLLENGCSLGDHTMTHPFLSHINPNEQFYEIMQLKVLQESNSDSPLTTMVFPYCNYNSGYEKEVQYDVGRAMMNAGIIGAPTPHYGRLERGLGYPPGTLAESGLLTPGDRDVSADLFYSQLKKRLADKANLEKNPSISISMHSWHTPEGMATLKRLMKEHAGSPDWWYCNQNEYAAYRFEANQTRVVKKVEGNTAIFTVTRFAPDQLGANVPLWFDLSGAKPEKVEGGTLREAGGLQAIELPHNANERIFELCARAGEDGRASKFPGVAASIVKSGDSLALTLANDGVEALGNVQLTLRCGAGYTPGVIRRQLGEVAPGSRGEWRVPLGNFDAAPRYRLGRPYFVAQFDFDREGKRCRLYLPLRLEADKEVISVGGAVKVFAPLPETFDPLLLSKPGIDVQKELGIAPLPKPAPESSAENSIDFLIPGKNEKVSKPFPVAALIEFQPGEAGEIAFTGNPGALYWNGRLVERRKSDGRWIIPAVAGTNRVLMVYECNSTGRQEYRALVPQPGKIRKFLP